MKRWLIVFFFAAPFLSAHEFEGKHFVASYLECDRQAIGDLKGLMEAMDRAVKASGATILDQAFHIFEPNGLTLVYLLSESHASIHTYPEYGACFVDLFTCGEICQSEPFHEAMREYLRPLIVKSSHFLRSGEEMAEIPLRN